MKLRVIDIETTGLEPPAEILEFGRCDVVVDDSGYQISNPLTRLYRPNNGIPAITKAVHHITEADIPTDAIACSHELLRRAILNNGRPDALVAHNCAFEQKFIGPDVSDEIPWICTYKVAMRLWPDAPGHSNQALRYWRELEMNQDAAMPPHRAGPDAWVTAHLLVDMLKGTTIEQMLAWTQMPKLLPSMPFGMFAGTPWAEIRIDYLRWVVSQSNMDEDVVWNANEELGRRMT